MAERYGNQQGIGYGLMALGNAVNLAEPERAIALLERAVEIATSLGAELLLANSRRELAHALAVDDQWARCLRVVGETVRAEMDVGSIVDLPYGFLCSVVPLLELGRRDLAAQLFSWLLANSPFLGNGLGEARPTLADELAPLPEAPPVDAVAMATLLADAIDELPPGHVTPTRLARRQRSPDLMLRVAADRAERSSPRGPRLHRPRRTRRGWPPTRRRPRRRVRAHVRCAPSAGGPWP